MGLASAPGFAGVPGSTPGGKSRPNAQDNDTAAAFDAGIARHNTHREISYPRTETHGFGFWEDSEL
jgi:hypothetical protein